MLRVLLKILHSGLVTDQSRLMKKSNLNSKIRYVPKMSTHEVLQTATLSPNFFLLSRHHEKSTHLFWRTSPSCLNEIRSIIIFMKFHFPFHQEWSLPPKNPIIFQVVNVQKKGKFIFHFPLGRVRLAASLQTNGPWNPQPSVQSLFSFYFQPTTVMFFFF